VQDNKPATHAHSPGRVARRSGRGNAPAGGGPLGATGKYGRAVNAAGECELRWRSRIPPGLARQSRQGSLPGEAGDDRVPSGFVT
jgi:hypothetical protein